MKQRENVTIFSQSNFIPLPEKVLVSDVCRDVYHDSSIRKKPSSITSNGFQDGFGEYSTHLPSEYRFFTNQPSYGLSFLEVNVVGPTYLRYPTSDELERHMASGKYQVLCLSAYTWSLPWAIETALRAKKVYGFVEVWLGGYAVMTDEPLMSKYFDKLFWGYSESSMNQAIGKESIGVENIKHPDLSTYAYFLGRKSVVGHILFQRGCPNKCTYCADPVFNPGGEPCLSLSEIERVIEHYKMKNINNIYFSNQETRLHGNYGKAVVDFMKKREMRFGLLTSFPALLANRHDGIKKLHNDGMHFLLLGLESLNESNLTKTNRKARLKMMCDTLKLLRDLKIIVTTTYMICFEDDTVETIKGAKDKMINDLGVTVNLFNITMPLPGTPMYWEYKSKQLITDWEWSRWTGNYLVWKHPVISPETAKELLAELRGEVNSPVYNPNVRAIWNSRDHDNDVKMELNREECI